MSERNSRSQQIEPASSKPSQRKKRTHQKPKPGASSSARAPFTFPLSHHLLITTASSIFSQDSIGTHCLFTSSRHGILAAKEAKDSSQALAVADRHTVIIHDCKRNREQSWGLEGGDDSDGGVRLLEYSPDDSGKLFMSTSLTGAIQCYSAGKEQVEDVGQQHPSKPIVMAVSPDGRTMISASENPTVVFVRGLKTREMARQLHPRVGDGSVVVAAFHPERAKVFLLGFKDGSLAAYHLTGLQERVGIDVRGARQDLDSVVREIGRFKRLHRMTNRGTVDVVGGYNDTVLSGWDEGTRTSSVGAKGVAITGAAFLPGHKSRAVSVGADGRCRLVEFEGETVLRTWEAGPSVAGAPIPAGVTTVSVLGVRERATTSEADGNRRKNLSHIIAVGRVDGMVLLFDSLGLVLKIIMPEMSFDKIINVEWIQGPSPRAIPTRPPNDIFVTHKGSQQPAEVVPVEEEKPSAVQGQSSTTKPVEATLRPLSTLRKPDFHPEKILIKSRRGTPVGLPSALKKSDVQSGVTISNTVAAGMSRGLPVENVSTVRHSPIAAKGSPRVRFQEGPHVDMFSPARQSPPNLCPRSPAVVLDPLRTLARPRLSSKTFREPQKRTKRPALYDTNGPISMEQHPALDPDSHSSEYLDIPEPLRLQKARGSSSTDSVAGVPASDLNNFSNIVQKRRDSSNRNRTKNINPALFAPYMNRTAVSRLPNTGYRRASSTELTRSPSSRSTKRTRSSLEPRVSGPMSMTVSMDGVNSIVGSEPRGTTTHLNTEWASGETMSSDRNVWLTATASESESGSESMSPTARRNLVRARLRESIQSPLSQTEFRSAEDTASSSSTIVPVHVAGAGPRDINNMPSRQDAAQPHFNLTPFSPASPPLFHRTLLDKHEPEQTQAVLGMSDEVMYTAASHITSDGSFYPASDDIRSIYPRTSSLSPRYHRKHGHGKWMNRPFDPWPSYSRPSYNKTSFNHILPPADQHKKSPYARLNHAAVSNHAFKDWPPVQAIHVPPPPLPAKSPKRKKSELQLDPVVVDPVDRVAVAAPLITVPIVDGIGVDGSGRSREKEKRKEQRKRRDRKNEKDTRHKEAREAAMTLLGKRPVPWERGMSRADTSKPPFRGGERMGSSDGRDTEKERAEEEENTFGQQETLMVYPGIGTVDRKYVERVPVREDEGARIGGEAGVGKERCKNCRILLKAKRELHEEVHALQNEVRRLEVDRLR